MHCEAIVEEELLQKNLCDCIKIIGGTPHQDGDKIWVDYDGRPDKVIALFEQFSYHTITTK